MFAFVTSCGKAADLGAGGGVPDLDGLVAGAADDARPVRRESNRVDGALVTSGHGARCIHVAACRARTEVIYVDLGYLVIPGSRRARPDAVLTVASHQPARRPRRIGQTLEAWVLRSYEAGVLTWRAEAGALAVVQRGRPQRERNLY